MWHMAAMFAHSWVFLRWWSILRFCAHQIVKRQTADSTGDAGAPSITNQRIEIARFALMADGKNEAEIIGVQVVI